MYILYGCYSRLANTFTFIEQALTSSNARTVCEALKLTASHIHPSHTDLRSIRAALHAFEGVITRGRELDSPRSCWTRGFEHPIGEFFSAALFILWIRRVEESRAQTPEQMLILEELRRLLKKGNLYIYEESLSATLALASVQLMDQVWIWGIMPVMADAFRFYAEDILGTRTGIMDQVTEVEQRL